MKLKALDQVSISSVKSGVIMPGEEFKVSDAAGKELMAKRPDLFEKVGDDKEDDVSDDKKAAAKAEPAPENKAEPAPKNKADALFGETKTDSSEKVDSGRGKKS